MKYGRRNPSLDLAAAERHIRYQGSYTAAPNNLTGIALLLLQEVRRQEGILAKERARNVRRRDARIESDRKHITYWLSREQATKREAERRVWERAIGVLDQNGFRLAARLLARTGWSTSVPNPTRDWFDKAIAEARANSEPSTFIAWLERGRATVTKDGLR